MPPGRNTSSTESLCDFISGWSQSFGFLSIEKRAGVRWPGTVCRNLMARSPVFRNFRKSSVISGFAEPNSFLKTAYES